MRMPLGNSILFLTLGFNKVIPGVISRRFSRYKGNSLGNNILARVNDLAKVNIPIGANLLIGFILNGVNFNILEMILSFKVVSIDRRSLCSGRIHYKITLEVCLQDGQVLSSI